VFTRSAGLNTPQNAVDTPGTSFCGVFMRFAGLNTPQNAVGVDA